MGVAFTSQISLSLVNGPYLGLIFGAMRELTLKIPEHKMAFFLELIGELGIEISENSPIPEKHKAEVLRRMELSEKDPSRLLDWDEVKDQFELG